MLNNGNCSVPMNYVMATNNDLLNLKLACGNGSEFKLTRFNSFRCKFKEHFQTTDKVVNSVTKRMYDCIVPPEITSLNCHSSNLVYLIACDVCHIQDVGGIWAQNWILSSSKT